MIDIKRTDGHWGDGSLVCSECGLKQATETAPSGAPLCEGCHAKLGVWTGKRIFDAVIRKLTGGDA